MRVWVLGFVMMAACSGGGTGGKACQPGASVACACTDGQTGAQLCDDGGHLDACSCTGGSGGNGTGGSGGLGGGGSGGGGGSTSQPGGPNIVAFTGTATTLTEAQSLTFSAIVTHPNGTDALAGGQLTTPDGAGTYGPFDAGTQKGAFSLSLSWAQIEETLNINFATSEPRVFRAVFYDSSGRMATQTLTVTLDCGGDPACNGGCVHPGRPIPSSCKTKEVDVYAAASCDSVCAGQGLSCGPYCFFGGSPSTSPSFSALATYGGNANEAYVANCGDVPKPSVTDANVTYAFSSLGCCCY